jgi:hypothetical protein
MVWALCDFCHIETEKSDSDYFQWTFRPYSVGFTKLKNDLTTVNDAGISFTATRCS